MLTLLLTVGVHRRSTITQAPGLSFSFGVREALADDDDDDNGAADDHDGQAAVDAANCAAQAGINAAQAMGVPGSVAVGIAATAFGSLSPGISPAGLAAAVGPAATQAGIALGVDPATAAAIGDAMAGSAAAGCNVTS